MEKKIIQSLWVGNSLSNLEILSIKSYQKFNNEFHLYIYNNIDNIPKGVIIKDANKIVPKEKIFKYTDQNTYSGFSNYFRYKLLYLMGGYWTDIDIVCLKDFDYKNEHVFCLEKTAILRFWKRDINNCFIKSPKNSKIMKYCYEYCDKLDVKKIKHGETGPKLLTKIVPAFKNENIKILKSYIINPVPYDHIKRVIKKNGNLNNVIRKSNCIHLYNDVWRRNNINKNDTFPKTSIYEILKKEII
jgi:hypothetical protein